MNLQLPGLAMATPPLAFSASLLTSPTGQATLLFVPFGLQSRGVTSCRRLGPSLPPIPVHRAAHAGNAAHLCCEQITSSLGIFPVGQGFLSADASSSSSSCSAGGVSVPVLRRPCWKRRQSGARCGLKSCECPDVLLSGEPEDAGDGVFGEATVARVHAFQERVRERAVSLADIAALYDYPLDEFQVQEFCGIQAANTVVSAFS